MRRPGSAVLLGLRNGQQVTLQVIETAPEVLAQLRGQPDEEIRLRTTSRTPVHEVQGGPVVFVIENEVFRCLRGEVAWHMIAEVNEPPLIQVPSFVPPADVKKLQGV